MYNRYKDSGLTALTVSVDELTPSNEQELKGKILKFLSAQNATFANFILNEKPEFWQQKLHFEGPPCVFVFDQKGKFRKQFKDEFTYDDVEKLVKELLGKQ